MAELRIDPRMVKWDEPPKIDANAVKWDDTPDPSILERAGRVAGLGARFVAEGVSAIPTIMADVAAGGVNLGIEGANKLGANIDYRMQQPSAVLERNLTAAGLPEPANATERVTGDVVRAMAGQGAVLKAGEVMANAAGPVIQRIGQTLATNPGAQGAAAAGSAGSAGVAREAGAGPVGQAVAGLAGGLVAGGLAAPKTPSAAWLEERAQNQTRDAVLKAGREAGYVVPPSTVKPTFANQQLEGVAGKVDLQQAASVRNAKVTDTLARQSLGLNSNAPLTAGDVAKVRHQAGRAYQAVKDFAGTFKLDQKFQDDVAAFNKDFAAAAKEFPEIVNDGAIVALQKSLTTKAAGGFSLPAGQKSMSPADYKNMLLAQQTGSVPREAISPKAAVELVKKLRFDASKNYRAFDDPAKAALADAQRGAANAIDGLIERNLRAHGSGSLATDYTKARTLIAKAHDIESALQPDGHVSAQVLNRIGQKGYLDGPLKVAADFAGTFPKAMQNIAQVGSPNVHALRPYMSMLGGGIGASVGGPAGATIGAGLPIVAPPIVRSGMLSRLYQNSIASPNYSQGVLKRGGGSFVANPTPTIQGILAALQNQQTNQ